MGSALGVTRRAIAYLLLALSFTANSVAGEEIRNLRLATPNTHGFIRAGDRVWFSFDAAKVPDASNLEIIFWLADRQENVIGNEERLIMPRFDRAERTVGLCMGELPAGCYNLRLTTKNAVETLRLRFAILPEIAPSFDGRIGYADTDARRLGGWDADFSQFAGMPIRDVNARDMPFLKIEPETVLRVDIAAPVDRISALLNEAARLHDRPVAVVLTAPDRAVPALAPRDFAITLANVARFDNLFLFCERRLFGDENGPTALAGPLAVFAAELSETKKIAATHIRGLDALLFRKRGAILSLLAPTGPDLTRPVLLDIPFRARQMNGFENGMNVIADNFLIQELLPAAAPFFIRSDERSIFSFTRSQGGGDPRLDVKARLTARENLLYLAVSLTNHSDAPLDGSFCVTKSREIGLGEKTFGFDRLEPGQTQTALLPVTARGYETARIDYTVFTNLPPIDGSLEPDGPEAAGRDPFAAPGVLLLHEKVRPTRSGDTVASPRLTFGPSDDGIALDSRGRRILQILPQSGIVQPIGFVAGDCASVRLTPDNERRDAPSCVRLAFAPDVRLIVWKTANRSTVRFTPAEARAGEVLPPEQVAFIFADASAVIIRKLEEARVHFTGDGRSNVEIESAPRAFGLLDFELIVVPPATAPREGRRRNP